MTEISIDVSVENNGTSTDFSLLPDDEVKFHFLEINIAKYSFT
jgi:hypothetical protein